MGQDVAVPGEPHRAQKGDDQKGNKEDGGGAEVLHNGKASQAEAGEQDEAIEVPLGKELMLISWK